MSRRLGLTLALAAALSGCGAFEGPQPSATEHSLCYTSTATGADELRNLAKEACGGSAPQFLKQGMDLSACPLLVPERAYFSCAGT